MATRERFALLLLLGLGLVGHAVRWLAGEREAAPQGLALIAAGADTDLARQRARSARLARPLGPGELVDLNRASADELTRLPRVGGRLAKAIVARRAELGGFLRVEELDQVPGIGPGLLAVIRPTVTLGDTTRVRRPAAASSPGPAVSRSRPTRGSERPLVVLPPQPSPEPGARRINVNLATRLELETLRGIGPARAKAIVAYREAHGPFASVEALELVPGISRRLVVQLATQVTVR